MGEDASRYDLLRRASQRELFHLQNGLDIASVRELAVQLRKMDASTFSHHVNDQRNDFSVWVKDVFGDDRLSEEILVSHDKEEMAKTVEQYLVEHEEEELERYGAHLPSNDLFSLEEYIEKREAEGDDNHTVKEVLIAKGWERKIVDLVLEGRDNPYKQYHDLRRVEDIDRFHEALEELKRRIIGAVAQGSTLDDVKGFLRKVGWHDDIVEFIIYDIFKPHPNLKKLATFIIHQVKDKNRPIEEVKADLLKLGWKPYIIDSVIYGIRQPENSLMKILSYLDEFSDDNHDQVKAFLLQMGWSELDVNDAIHHKELEQAQARLRDSFNLDDGDAIKEQSDMVSYHVVRLFEHQKDLWKRLLKEYRKMPLSSFQKSNGELHMADQYEYYFSLDDIRMVGRLEGDEVGQVFFKDPTSPLLIEGKRCFLILPRIIKRQCMVCGKLFSITKMKRVEMWDEKRTHKVSKHVCLRHAKQVENFLEETRIIQT